MGSSTAPRTGTCETRFQGRPKVVFAARPANVASPRLLLPHAAAMAAFLDSADISLDPGELATGQRDDTSFLVTGPIGVSTQMYVADIHVVEIL